MDQQMRQGATRQGRIGPGEAGYGNKRRISQQERQRRRDDARHAREAERRSLAVLHGMPLEPRIDAATLAARRAEMPERDLRDLTGRVFGDPNPADRRRRRSS